MWASSHRGRVRARNEDAWWLDPALRLAMVADGMGGHPAGADASALAVRAFSGALTRDGEGSSNGDRGEAMARSVEAAHGDIRAAVEAEPAHEGMGTTLTAAALGPGDELFVAHVGDSRAYLFRDGVLVALTRDHTWVREAVEMGRIPAGAADNHPMSHVLTQAVGIEFAPRPDVERVQLRADDVVLLCSDGLTGPVPDAEIRRILDDAAASATLDAAPERLVEAALDAGGPDNVTVVVLLATDAASGTAAGAGTDAESGAEDRGTRCGGAASPAPESNPRG